MGVLREISERHPEIKVKRAFAGDGPYDINSMFDAITKGETEMPSTVCNLLYAYNHFFRLGYDIHDYLKDPVAKNFDEWFLSKQNKRRALDEELIKTKKTSDLLTDAFLDASNPLSRRFSAAFRGCAYQRLDAPQRLRCDALPRHERRCRTGGELLCHEQVPQGQRHQARRVCR